MKPITDASQVGRYLRSVDEMLVAKGTYQRNFDPVWLQNHQWKVVPAKSETGHFNPEEIERIVPTLNQAGFTECLAVATEFLDPLPVCYQVIISPEDLNNFNKECALLGYLLMDAACSWAISCYGSYKLFAGPTELLEALLGSPIPIAREAFRQYSEELDEGLADSPYQKMALRYEGM